MKSTKIALEVFLLTFLLGYVSVPTKENIPAPAHPPDAAQTEAPAAPRAETKSEPESVKEAEPVFEEQTVYKIKLLETGGVFHGDEIRAKSGEIWFGLFEQADGYFLRPAKIKVRRVRDPIGDDYGQKTGKIVSVKSKNPSVFLLKNAERLRERRVTTVFFAASYKEAIEMRNGFVAQYQLGGRQYTLRVVNEKTTGEFISDGSKLVLESGDTRQILNVSYGANDASWRLFWVGDLDGDGKPDFYADLADHYNFNDKVLFLSSEAETGKLAKKVALFSTSGC